jgi:phosphomannomutase
VADVKKSITRIEAHFMAQGPEVDRTDGLSLDFGTWRFNLRGSNTEPLLRLNVESRGDPALVQLKVAEIAALIAV